MRQAQKMNRRIKEEAPYGAEILLEKMAWPMFDREEVEDPCIFDIIKLHFLGTESMIE